MEATEITHKLITQVQRQDKILTALYTLSNAIDDVKDMDSRVQKKINDALRNEPYADIERISVIIWKIANEIKFHGRANYQKKTGLLTINT